MNIALWIIQAVAAAALIGAGIMKISMPIPRLATLMPFAKVYSEPSVRLIGTAEILGGLGLLLPGITGILPWLTLVAAACIAVITIGAINYNLRYHSALKALEPGSILLMMLLVLVGRTLIAPF